jgi:hypothetical protein
MIYILELQKSIWGGDMNVSRIVVILGVLEGLFYLIIVMGRVCRTKASPV